MFSGFWSLQLPKYSHSGHTNPVFDQTPGRCACNVHVMRLVPQSVATIKYIPRLSILVTVYFRPDLPHNLSILRYNFSSRFDKTHTWAICHSAHPTTPNTCPLAEACAIGTRDKWMHACNPCVLAIVQAKRLGIRLAKLQHLLWRQSFAISCDYYSTDIY